jgi:hypothetical protein
VIGVVSEGKEDVARAAGCDAVLVWGAVDLPTEVVKLTDGRKADVVYDSIGRQTFEASLDSLRSRGMLVSFGTASGPPPPVELATLNKKGSLFLTRPSVFAYTADAGEYRQRAADVLAALAAGIIQASVWKTFPLAEVAKAHTAIERQSSGAIVMAVAGWALFRWRVNSKGGAALALSGFKPPYDPAYYLKRTMLSTPFTTAHLLATQRAKVSAALRVRHLITMISP